MSLLTEQGEALHLTVALLHEFPQHLDDARVLFLATHL
jgi:hypothetical protein